MKLIIKDFDYTLYATELNNEQTVSVLNHIEFLKKGGVNRIATNKEVKESIQKLAYRPNT